MKKNTRIVLSVILGTVLTALAYYFILPPLNLQSTSFWMFLLAVVCFYGIPLGVARIAPGDKKNHKNFKFNKVFLVIAAVPVAVLIIGGVISSTFFNAKAYASIIAVEEADFAEDMPEADTVTNISLMDSSAAATLGNRELSELADVVSQFVLSSDYNQINYLGTPRKVSHLEYVDIIRWINNREGIPGYVMVDPVNSDATYVEFKTPLRYVDSAYFHEDLMRKLRFSYPTKIFGDINFEIDEEGNPYFIVSCMKPRVGLFGAVDVNEVIIFNPCDGSSDIYSLEDTPAWIDNVFNGYLAAEKYDWYGTLQGGFWNSVIGNQGCKQTTDDFGYIVLGDDVWYFTGVTSVTGDESNIGFIITNARTGEYKYYPVGGAEEYSAMGAAEGEVQEKGYVASFPSLINVSGQATYIMVLKDSNNIVKLYALVNVENYSIVATGASQQAAKEAYLKLLAENGIIEKAPDIPENIETDFATVLVTDIRLAIVDGETMVYLNVIDESETPVVYKGTLASDETLMLIEPGQTLTIEYAETDHTAIRRIVGWKTVTVPEVGP